jgi:hypothetical protein
MEPGERVLWVGHPDPDFRHGGRIVTRTLAVVVGGAAVLIFWSRLSLGPPLWFYAIGVVIIGMNLFGTAVGPSLRRARLRQATYAMTDRRAAVLPRPDSSPHDVGVATPLVTVTRSTDGVHGSVDWGPSAQSGATATTWPVAGGPRRRRTFAVQMGLRDPDADRVVFTNVADFSGLLNAMTLARRAWGVDTPTGLPGQRFAPPLPWQQRPGPPPPA